MLFAAAALMLGTVADARAGDVVKIGFKSGKEPYVLPKKPFKKSDFDPSNALGIEIEICREAFAVVGKTIEPVYMNYKRMPHEIQAGNIDAAGQLVADVPGVTYVKEYVALHDHAIYDPSKAVKISTLKDLEGRRVLAFQRAKDFMGPAYVAAIAKAKSYKEIDDQEKQVRIFLSGRTDVVILDIGIFKHWAKVYGKPGAEYGYAPVFGDPFFFAIGFKDKALSEQFRTGWKTIKENGVYDAIIKKYLE